MMNLVGGLIIVVAADRDVSYSEVEDALKVERSLGDYLINRIATPDRTPTHDSVHVPMSAITGGRRF